MLFVSVVVELVGVVVVIFVGFLLIGNGVDWFLVLDKLVGFCGVMVVFV